MIENEQNKSPITNVEIINKNINNDNYSNNTHKNNPNIINNKNHLYIFKLNAKENYISQLSFHSSMQF